MLASNSAGGEAAGALPPPAADLRAHKSFHSEFLSTDRDVLVCLPPCYAREPARRYPVLYLHDGQNLFDGTTSFIPGQDWRVGQTAAALIGAGAIEPLIIVGVYNTGVERVEEYTPTADARFKVGGKADLYGRLLVEELKPFIDARYRTRAGAADTGLGGSSLGGLASLYLGLRYPEVFGKLAVISPSVWWGGRAILKSVAELDPRPRPRIWLDMGTAEGKRAAPDARALRDALVAKGWRLGADLSYLEVSGGRHDEAAWAKRVEPVLRFLFPKEN
jgi:predicted alpha/beta superfamily hydrolase